MAVSNPLHTLRELGQSVWYDYIRKDLVETGALAKLIDEDRLGGLTSNPSIFDKAITGSDLYDASIRSLVTKDPGIDTTELFYQLAITDLQGAADAFLPLYEASRGLDGYVSLEVSPSFAYDTQATVDEAMALFARVNRPNLMIKVPATLAGVPAVEQLIAQGINVNVTLLFAVERYQAVLEAYLRGLEIRRAKGLDISNIASVASFFVSRVDTATDHLLDAKNLSTQARELLYGKVALANAQLAYAHFREIYTSARHCTLTQQGAQPQRLLWASTGTKNPAYSDVLYVESLIGRDTVNTVPPATYDAFKDHGKAALTLDGHAKNATLVIEGLARLGITLDEITSQLEQEGIQAFVDAFAHLLQGLEEKRKHLQD